MGALARRFERDRVFMSEPTVTGPGRTSTDTENGDLALRFGTYPPRSQPKERRLWRFTVLTGDSAEDWATLSDMEKSAFIVSRSLAIQW
jgi:hypothetical protein